ncbi:MAG: cytidine deaminase [Bacteroidia bacterium]|nr:cytidine deaminase [Bacteroidia bacterium]
MIKTNNISFTFKEFDTVEELESSDRELVKSASEAALNAYAPYSGFRVGAAVRLASGIIVTGSNVENAAFPSGICAERNALSNASANHPGNIPMVLAVAAITEAGNSYEPVSPCGNCRQVIAEEEIRSGKSIRIILSSKNKIQVIEQGGDLLPLQFSRNNLPVTPC